MNRKAIFILIILMKILKLSLTVEDSTCYCGETEYDTSRRIVGGTEAKIRAHPWMAAIVKNYEIICSGSLIDDSHVLTASHCIIGDSWKRFIIYFNLYDWDNTTNAVIRKVASVDLYNKKDVVNGIKNDDIAILTLNTPVKFSLDIVPICLPNIGENFAGRLVNLAGWGLTEVNGYSASKLQEVQLKILPKEQCQGSIVISSMVRDNSFCALGEGKDGCQGDSGGPLTYEVYPGKWQQLGIMSWGIGCANAEYPGVYTDVSKYTDWIKNVTKNAVKCRDENIFADDD